MDTIGSRIRQRRTDLGLSVDDLAEKLGKNRATVYRYEDGGIENVPITVVASLCIALETTPGWLMGWTEDKPATEASDGHKSLLSAFNQLTPDNQTKLLELCHLFLASQHSTQGNE